MPLIVIMQAQDNNLCSCNIVSDGRTYSVNDLLTGYSVCPNVTPKEEKPGSADDTWYIIIPTDIGICSETTSVLCYKPPPMCDATNIFILTGGIMKQRRQMSLHVIDVQNKGIYPKPWTYFLLLRDNYAGKSIDIHVGHESYCFLTDIIWHTITTTLTVHFPMSHTLCNWWLSYRGNCGVLPWPLKISSLLKHIAAPIPFSRSQCQNISPVHPWLPMAPPSFRIIK